MARSWVRLFAGAMLTLSLTGHALADEGKITVFAAASLTNALQDIAAAYKKEKNVEVVSSFASSSTLARQIEAGAPADLFISADQKWMDYAAEKKSIDATTRETLLGNSLVVVAPKASAQADSLRFNCFMFFPPFFVDLCKNSTDGSNCSTSSPHLQSKLVTEMRPKGEETAVKRIKWAVSMVSLRLTFHFLPEAGG